jgi:hypothetical protein
LCFSACTRLLLFVALLVLVELLVDAAVLLVTRVSPVASALLQSRSRKVSGSGNNAGLLSLIPGLCHSQRSSALSSLRFEAPIWRLFRRRRNDEIVFFAVGENAALWNVLDGLWRVLILLARCDALTN